MLVHDRPWQEALPLYTPAELLHRIMKWFERAGRGGLHDMRQPLDPFFMPQGVHVVMPRNVFDSDPQARTSLRPVQNADGSFDIYFGPKSPGEGKNWLATIPGKGWFTIFRLYGPKQAFFDQTWKLNDIEKAK
jgi:hypothetical protein